MEKIIFQVVLVNGEKLFQVSGQKKNLFLNKILAGWFEGYHHCTNFQVIRNNELCAQGYVNHYGTHCSTDYFFIDEHMVREILAESSEVDDILEMENIDKKDCHHYESIDQFIDQVIRFQEFSQSLDEVLAANNGKLSGQEFINALVACSIGSDLKGSLTKVTIIRL